MLKQTLIAAVVALQGATLCLAQTVPSPNPHRDYDAKASACRQQADAQSLQGEDRRAFLAQCMKAPAPAPDSSTTPR